MTTRPFLFIDLQKGTWREELHPRDKFGRFTTVKGGSRVTTKTGKTGVVDKVTATHYHITTDDGKKTKVLKENAIHENDHKKVMEAKKKEERKRKAIAKKAGKKASKTKAQKKADGRHKTEVLADPTAKKKTASKATKKTATKTKATTKKTVTKKTAKKEAPKKEKVITNYESESKVIKNKPIGEGTDKTSLPQKQQNQAIAEFKNAEKELPKAQDVTIDQMWNSSEVQKLMSLPPNRRSADKIRELAGKMTEANDRLARHVVNKRLSALGIGQSYNIIGNKATPSSKVIKQETGLYGDMLQSARGAMYETLLSVLSGSQNPGAGVSIGAHVVNRMKDKITKDLYGFMNHIPAPHEIRPAINDMKNYEMELSHELGRTPTHEELAHYLEASSEHFRNAPIAPAPRWDANKGEWIAGRGKVEDPVERLSLLKQYHDIQKTTSANAHIGSEGEKEVTINDNAVDDRRTPEEEYERKERQKELEETLPKAMRAMGMSDASIKVWTLTHSAPSEKRNIGQLTSAEVADIINKEGGWEGKKITESWVRKHYSAGRKVIEEAIKNNHPAIAQLRLLKSFVFNMMLKAVYEYNLIKSLYAWGMDESILRDKFVRTATGRNLFDIKKSLAPTEYIGSYVVVDTGQVHARIVTHELPKGEELTKAFRDFEELQKALFHHKEGGNHAINQKATEYVKKNSGKYKSIANSQAERVRKKSGQLTWSEELLLKNPGSAWITWGGKQILVNASTGEILYDSRNEAHREEHNQGAQEDKIDFHHEAEEAEDKKKELMEQAQKEHSEGNYGRSLKKWAEKYGVKTKEVVNEKGKKEVQLDLDEQGNLQFDHSKMNLVSDHGVQAFEESLKDLQDHLAKHKKPAIDELHHRAIGMYGKLSDEEREAYDKMSTEEREKFVGNHIASQEGVRELLERAQALASEGKKGKEIQAELANELAELGKKHNSMALKNKEKMTTVFNMMTGKKPASMEEVIQKLGAQEISRAREEANKRIVPEGYYEIGNKQNGKSMVVKIGHRVDPETGNFTSYVQEAFDPKTGKHFTTEDVENSWGQLGKELGLKNNSAESFIYNSNKADNDAVMQAMDEEEAKELRKKTALGMQDSMLHKDFKMVEQKRDKNGNVVSTTYAMDMPDETQNVIEVGSDGYVKDPIMARFLDLRKPIRSVEDLHEALKNAVGKKIWVTAHMGSDIHIGDALGHHVQLMYDGKGAPIVVGGVYDGYRFMDAKDVPKGAIDQHTGEPIKALFKNGKLVDRKFTTKNEVPMEKGNAVMYQDGGRWRKGKIRDIQNGNFQVVDSKGNLIGMFKKEELKPAKAEGRMLSQSGQAVVRLAQDGTHRMNISEAFGDDKKSQKALELFKQALQKAKINKAFDEEGNLNKELELNDKHMERLKKVLGRSKAGRELLSRFKSAYKPELEIHVPEHLRKVVEAEGVKVGKDGTARISTGKFEHLREVLGGLSLDHKAQDYLKDHFRRKDRTPRSVEELKKDYQPSVAEGIHADEFRKQFKPDSFLMNPKQGLYGTQLEGVAHLVERGRGIAGHGINSTLAVTFVA